jgi:hypothetical protein
MITPTCFPRVGGDPFARIVMRIRVSNDCNKDIFRLTDKTNLVIIMSRLMRSYLGRRAGMMGGFKSSRLITSLRFGLNFTEL